MEVRNRFKGLDLIDRVPDELWNEVHDTVQETRIKTIPMEMKWKGERESCSQLNAKFYRIAKRYKKAFLNEQYKEIEENNRMGKTRDLIKKIRDTKGTFHAKMGSINDRNGMDLTEAEDIKEVARIHRKTIKKRSSRPR